MRFARHTVTEMIDTDGGTMENRERILACALDLFYLKGYDAVGIQEICREAGVTKPTMYHYFGSKYGLLETLLRERLEELFDILGEALREGEGVEHALYRFLSVLTDYASANYKGYLFIMSLYYSPRENETYRAVQPYMQRMHAHAVQIFEQSARELGNMNGRQEQFALGFLGLINHYIMFQGYQEIQRTGVAASKEQKYSLLHQFLHGIYS